MNTLRSSLLVLLALGEAALVAQTQVIPADFATTEAPTSTAFPFGLSTAARVQYLYGAQETGLASPMFVQSLNLRANNTSTNVAKTGISLQISLSTTATTVGTASSTFAANHGPNLVVAYARKPTNLAATSPQQPVGGFGGPFVLDTPFVYDPAAGNLLIDFDVASQPAGTWAMDTPYTTAGTHASAGTGCGGLVASSSGGALGGPLTLSLSGAAPLQPATLFVGLSLLPAPLPIPGTNSCFLYQDIVASASTTISATGAASMPFTVPADARLRGGVLQWQWAALNASFGLDTSATRTTTLSSWVVLRVHNTSSNVSPTGTVQNYVGIVIELG